MVLPVIISYKITITTNMDLFNNNIIHTFRILFECSLVKQEQNGRGIYYHINAERIKEIADFVGPFRKLCDDKFNKLESMKKNYKTKG